jgi:hypothetical protein
MLDVFRAIVATASEALADVRVYESASGPTLSAAESAAQQQFAAAAYGCGQRSLYSDSQQADGTWNVIMGAYCQGYL